MIDNGKQLVIYDCGSTEHAEVVLKYMEKTSMIRSFLYCLIMMLITLKA